MCSDCCRREPVLVKEPSDCRSCSAIRELKHAQRFPQFLLQTLGLKHSEQPFARGPILPDFFRGMSDQNRARLRGGASRYFDSRRPF